MSENILVGTKNNVLRSTFFYLALSMIPTVIAAKVGLHYNVQIFMAQHTLITVLGFLGLSLGLSFLISATENKAVGFVGLMTFAALW